jgi:hypothetical protein
VDYFTNYTLDPLHIFLQKYLSKIPCDGTIDQNKISMLVKDITSKSFDVFCSDYVAATDNLPANLIAQLLDIITGKDGFGKA